MPQRKRRKKNRKQKIRRGGPSPDLGMGWWDPDAERKALAKAAGSAPAKTPPLPAPRQRPRKPRPLTYAERDEMLLTMGFPSYKVYLESPLWRQIRGGVFSTKGRRCWVCRRRGKARHVHHEYYTEANLSGASDAGLRPICPGCHYRVEFTDGEKLSTRQSRKKSAALRRRPRKTKRAKAKAFDAKLRRLKRAGRDLDAEFQRLVDRDG